MTQPRRLVRHLHGFGVGLKGHFGAHDELQDQKRHSCEGMPIDIGQFCVLDPEPDPVSVELPASVGGVVAAGLGVGLGEGTGNADGVGIGVGVGVGTGVVVRVATEGSDEEATVAGVLVESATT